MKIGNGSNPMKIRQTALVLLCGFLLSTSITAAAPNPRYIKKPQDNPVQGDIVELCFGRWLPKKHGDVELQPMGWQKTHADWCNSTLVGRSPEFVANALLNRMFTQPAILDLVMQQQGYPRGEFNKGNTNNSSANPTPNANPKSNATPSFKHPYKLEFVILSKENFKQLKPEIQVNLSRYEEWGTEGFAYSVENRTITFYGKTQLAHEHAVFHLMENVFACNYYTADAVDMPLLSKVNLKPKEWNKVFAATKITKQVVPVFKYREVFYGEARRGIYAQWHGLSYGESAGTFEKHPGWGMWVHTLHKLLPPEKYFNDHPEYYALRNGVRLKDQVCMSSTGALQAVIEQLKIEVEKNPTAMYWSVSQMDNYNHCECDQCQSVDAYEGSHSGSLLRFVNQVASVFPHKIISTLAYQYSRRPPKVTKPLPNVNIMLCTIEENRAVDLRGTSFERDLAAWSGLTKNILIWDYVINFSHMVMPFPNFHILPTNMLLFQKYGVPMVFEQGYNSVGSEMQEFRCFLLSKLMWMEGKYLSDTPEQEEQYRRPRYSESAKKHIKQTYEQFFNGYYRDASGWVMGIMSDHIRDLWDSKKPLTLYEPPINHAKGFLRLNNVEESLNIWSGIGKNGRRSGYNLGLEQQMKDSFMLFRVERLLQPYRYSFLEIAKYPEITEGGLYRWKNKLDSSEAVISKFQERYQGLEPIYGEMLNQFVSFANLHGPKLLHEIKLSPNEYKQSIVEYYKNAVSVHQAVGKKLLYISVPDKAYQAKALGWREEPLMMTTVIKSAGTSHSSGGMQSSTKSKSNSTAKFSNRAKLDSNSTSETASTSNDDFTRVNSLNMDNPLQTDSFVYKYLHVQTPEWVKKGPNGQLLNVGIGKPVEICVSTEVVLKLESPAIESEQQVSWVRDRSNSSLSSKSLDTIQSTSIQKDSSRQFPNSTNQQEKPVLRYEEAAYRNSSKGNTFKKFTYFQPFAGSDYNINAYFSKHELQKLDSISADLSLLPNVWYIGQPLVDGIRASEEYQRNWQGWWGRNMQVVIDLGKLDTIRSVSIHYLENNQAWIVGPSKMTVIFDQSNTYTEVDNQAESLQSAAPQTIESFKSSKSKSELKIPTDYRFSYSLTATNEQAGRQMPLGIGELVVKPDKPIVARYLHVTVYNPGPLPKWRGVNGDGWLFVDEVEVK